jgi:hypothetical protein
MALSVHSRPTGAVWPLGAIVVPTPGTPVCIMSLVDANNNNSPEVYNGPGGTPSMAYVPACHQLLLQGVHPGANNNGMVMNTGPAYLMVKPATGGSGNRTDSGAMMFVLWPGSPGEVVAIALDRDSINPYQFFIDVDNANDGVLASLVI